MRMIDADEMALNESEAYMSAQTKIESPITLGLNSVVHRKIQQLIADTPTVDAVEVVRCKDCKRWSQRYDDRTYGSCERLVNKHLADNDYTEQDHFCSYGVRKEGADNG